MSAEPTKETLPFQAEVNQLLNLVIHSLYSNKEIFLRELISNASDALDRLRFRAITEPELMNDGAELEIRIIPDVAAGTLTIEDTGVGMTREELVKDLGTIARSGSKAFLEQLAEKAKDVQLIGQFGVGFYSAYLVADRVEVVSRAAGTNAAHRWSSDAKGTFTVEPAERATRGTQVVLHFKADQKELLEEWRLREMIRRYSDYVSHPIKLQVSERDEKGEAKGTKLEVVNAASALWQRPKSQITEEQYAEFYKHLSHDFDAPLAHTHFTAEGAQQFTSLLFVPKHAPFDLNSQKRRGVRLFVRRVFIMDDCEELLPQWLRFVRGVVDSDDLPLNVSREILQDSNVVRVIRKQVTKKTLDLLDKLAKDKPDDYRTFWEAFGSVLKEGLALDQQEYRERLAPLLRYESSRGEGLTSLTDYVARMPKEQTAIYYLIGEQKDALAASPYLEALKKKGFEVLLMTEPVDEWATDGLREFEGKPLVSAMKADLKLEKSDEEKKQDEEKASVLKPLLETMKELLANEVREVRASDRLVDTPACLVVPEGGTHAFMERLLKERGHGMPHLKRIFEVNPSHPLILGLKAMHERDAKSERLRDWIHLLYDQAVVTEGGRPADPNAFARRVTALMTQAASA